MDKVTSAWQPKPLHQTGQCSTRTNNNIGRTEKKNDVIVGNDEEK